MYTTQLYTMVHVDSRMEYTFWLSNRLGASLVTSHEYHYTDGLAHL